MFIKDALKADLLTTLKSKLIKSSKLSLKDFIESLSEKEQALFLEYKIEDLFDLSILKKDTKEEEKKAIASVAVNKDEYLQKVLHFLKEAGVGESGRGYATAEIAEACGGDADTTRKILSLLKEDKKVWDTGKTRKMKWVVWENKQKAIEAFVKQEQNN